MPTPTYTPIASTTLSGAASEITFSGIPQNFRDLIIVVNGTVNSAAYCQLRFNGDASSSYASMRAYGLGTSFGSEATTGTSTLVSAVIGTAQSAIIFNVMDYVATDKHKTLIARSMSGVTEVWMGSARWNNTAAITSVSLSLNVSAYNIGTTVNIYGVIA